MANYWAYNIVVNEWAAYENISTVAYSDETVYEGRTHNFEFPMQAVAAGGNGYLNDEALANKSPDSVMKVDPRFTAIKRSIITLTDTGGIAYKLYRNQLMNGGIQNADPFA